MFRSTRTDRHAKFRDQPIKTRQDLKRRAASLLRTSIAKTMSASAETSKTSTGKANPANPMPRPVAVSVKAIMHSRHANTRRNIKRPPPQPCWIREMIVVKEYDQMDSLREILEEPARIYPEAEDSDAVKCSDSHFETQSANSDCLIEETTEDKRLGEGLSDELPDGTADDELILRPRFKRKKAIEDTPSQSDGEESSREKSPGGKPLSQDEEFSFSHQDV